MKSKSIITTVGGIILLAVFAFYEASLEPNRPILIEEQTYNEEQESAPLMPDMSVIISDARVQHILYGDGSGGGHKHGVGKPCKSEFPESWDDEKIITVTRRIASNDNLPWKRESNGYFVTEAFQDAVKVRVVKGPQKQRVITSYPVNVPRNPCPL